MSFRDILVHLKSYEAWSPHIDVAADLAKRFNAHLTGLYNDADLAILKHIASGPGPGPGPAPAPAAAAIMSPSVRRKPPSASLGPNRNSPPKWPGAGSTTALNTPKAGQMKFWRWSAGSTI